MTPPRSKLPLPYVGEGADLPHQNLFPALSATGQRRPTGHHSFASAGLKPGAAAATA